MRMTAILMAVLSLLGSPRAAGRNRTSPGRPWRRKVLEEPPTRRPRRCWNGAETGQTAPEAEVESFLKGQAEPAAEAAAAFAAVLDAADGLRAAGEAPELEEEDYREAVRVPVGLLYPAFGDGDHALERGALRLAWRAGGI